MRDMVFVVLVALGLVGVALGDGGPTTGIDWGNPATWNNGGAWLLIGCALWWMKTDGTRLIAAWIDAQKAQAVAAAKMADAVEHIDRLAEAYFHRGNGKGEAP